MASFRNAWVSTENGFFSVLFKIDFDDVRNDVDDWKVGDIVIHKKLGKGIVVALEGDDIIKVNFEEHGEKSILGTHPSVSKGGHEA